MFGNHFYHQRIRTAVSMFGSMFNDIYVLRKAASGQVLSQVKVPLTYATRDKFIVRIRENPDLTKDQRVALKLPRISFEITGIAYDPQRQLQKTANFNKVGTTNNTRNKFKAPVPYTISFQLNTYTKTQDDGLQLIEQIIPYFAPQYSVTIKPFSDHPTIKEDVPVALTSVAMNDDYEGSLDTRRTIIYTLDFQMRVNFYGPISDSSIIRKSIAKLDINNKDISDSDTLAMTITPTPTGVGPDSDYGFLTTYDYENE